ncbi:protein GrpE [Deinococcus malanensis]|uniref:Protein GrpE n=1 Tax=Deinococcus malanensis TaxID=1706855 RepID=A0ABQ2EZD7_9DEIO|nr:nucleotide exchange factor GrpE [Deinococcus malanensis]GGK28264.1 protein GrpE [Deinococcus malanensis]
MTNDDQKNTGSGSQAEDTTETLRPEMDGETSDVEVLDAETDNMEEDADLSGFPDMDEGMFAQVQEMMGKLQRADELEKENADLRHRLGRLAADFESYRTRTAQDSAEAQGHGVSKAAEALMPVYDDIDRAVTMGSGDPAKLIPGMQAVQGKVLNIFSGLGLEATGKEGEAFDPQWHEAIQVVPGEQDDTIVQVYQLGFRMGDRLVRPARVVVSKKD